MSQTPRERKTRKAARSTRQSDAAQKAGPERLISYLSRGILVLGVFILFVPQIVNYDFYYPYIFLKAVLFRTGVQGMALLYVLLALVSPAHRPRFNRITWALLFYFGALAICSLPGISMDAWSSWWGEFSRMGGMLTQLHLFAYFFVLTHTFNREREWLVLFTASLFGSTFMGLSGLIQYLNLNYLYRYSSTDGPRVIGATGNPNWFASYMLLNFFVALWFLSRKDKEDVYPQVSKTWLLLLIGLDLSLLIADAVGLGPKGGIIYPGMKLFPIVFFALALHAASLLWFFMRRNVRVGFAFLSLLSIYHLFWIYQSQTRAAVMGLAGSLIFVALFYLWAGTNKKVKCLLVAQIAIIGILASCLWFGRQSAWMQRYPAFARYTSTSYINVAERLLAWKASVHAILDRPVFGWGLENYKNAFDRYFPSQISVQYGYALWYDRAHNVIIDMATTAGLVGLAAYLAFHGLALFFLLRSGLRTKGEVGSLLIAALLAAYLIQNLFSFDTVNTDGILFLVLAYVAFRYGWDNECYRNTPANLNIAGLSSWKKLSLFTAAAGLAAIAFWQFVKIPCESNLLLNQAVTSEMVSDPQAGIRRFPFPEEIVDRFQRASEYQTTGRYMVREEFAGYALRLSKAWEVPLAERADVIKRAVVLLEESIRQEPGNVRHYVYAGTLINRTFPVLQQLDPGLARSMAEKSSMLLQMADSLSPTRPQISFERGQALAALGRTGDSITAFKRGLDLDSTKKEPHIGLIRAYISAELYDDAAAELRKMPALGITLSPEDYDLVISSYGEKKQYAPIARLYEERLAATPDDPLLLAGLAMTYREMGEMNRARELALRAASRSPQAAFALRQFLNSLESVRK